MESLVDIPNDILAEISYYLTYADTLVLDEVYNFITSRNYWNRRVISLGYTLIEKIKDVDDITIWYYRTVRANIAAVEIVNEIKSDVVYFNLTTLRNHEDIIKVKGLNHDEWFKYYRLAYISWKGYYGYFRYSDNEGYFLELRSKEFPGVSLQLVLLDYQLVTDIIRKMMYYNIHLYVLNKKATNDRRAGHTLFGSHMSTYTI